MNRRTATRLATAATLVAIGTSLVGGAVASASPGIAPLAQAGLGRDPARDTANPRTAREVDVAALPEVDPSATRGSGGPALGVPDVLAAAPDTVGAPVGPVQSTGNGDDEPSQATAFPGLQRTKGPTDGEPPDPWVATGPEHVVQAVNTAFRISDRSGNTLQTVDMFDFFGLGEFYNPGEVDYFDPRVIYDSLHRRWVAVEASFDCFLGNDSSVGSGYIDIAVSDGPDPTDNWNIYSIYYPDALPDYPGLGTSTDKIVASANVFEIIPGGDMGCHPDGFLGTEMDVLAWSDLTDGDPDFNVAYLFSGGAFTNNFFTWRPALQAPATSSTVFAIAVHDSLGVAYARITGSPANGGATNVSITNSLPGVAPFANPPQPIQPGPPATIVDAVDFRPTDAIWKDNRLAFVSTRPCDPSGGVSETRDCVRVSELSTATAPTPALIQDFLVAESGADLFMGGIGYALNDDLHVVWTRSSGAAGQYPSSYAAYQAAGVDPNTLSDRALLSAGTASYAGVRWGDYVGVAQDPQVPNAVWQGNEYSVGSNGWATEVTQLQTGGTGFAPVEARVLDTRPGIQIGLSGVFAANTPRTFQVAGVGGIPANAIAVTGNLTVVGQTAGGYVSVTPTPVANPASSTLNFPHGDTRANNVTVPLSASGSLSAVYKAPAGRSTHLILDITGYFVAPVPGDTATYTTMTPARVLDSRFNVGLAGRFFPNVPRRLRVAGVSGIPADAVAITGNLTVVGQTRAGFVSVTASPDATPATSTINFPLGDTRANGVTVPLDAAGHLAIVFKASGGTTHVILDVTGYYRTNDSGLLFYPLTPGRVMDTRSVPLSGQSGPFAANVPEQLDVAGHWGAPNAAKAITGNLTVVGQTAAGYVSATLASDATPDTSVLNFPLGDVRANGVTLPLNGAGNEWFVYKAPGGRSTHLILDLSGYFR